MILPSLAYLSCSLKFIVLHLQGSSKLDVKISVFVVKRQKRVGTPRAWNRHNERLNFEDYSSVNASQDEAVRSFFVVGVADEFIDERASGVSWRFSQEKIRFRKEKQIFEENSHVSPNGLRIRHLAGEQTPRLKLQSIPWLTTMS